jgi:hypothetical protein
VILIKTAESLYIAAIIFVNALRMRFTSLKLVSGETTCNFGLAKCEIDWQHWAGQ